ncbi:MAG: hypothetical protein KW788_04550 [Candidatus Doudnabacteria bacterium]|nr:hypothetical protein [Candidatus Doudnabacteria bacterium]
MDREQLLTELRQAAASGLITQADVSGVFGVESQVPVQNPDVTSRKLNLSHIFYYIGAAIVFLGLCIFVFQNWEMLNFPARILVTLGAGIAAYIVGMSFSFSEKFKEVALAFFLISATIMPIGLGVMLDNSGFQLDTAQVQAVIAGVMFVVFLTSFFIKPNSLFVLLDIIFGTWLFFALTSTLVGNSGYYFDWRFAEYRWLLVGLSFMLLGYSFLGTLRASLAGVLNAFGTLAFLGAALALGGWSPGQNAIWEIIFPALVFGVIVLSVYLKSRAYLTFGSIFLMIYILKITSEYFSTGFGWPIALIIAGLGLIAVGYFALQIKKKYLI